MYLQLLCFLNPIQYPNHQQRFRIRALSNIRSIFDKPITHCVFEFGFAFGFGFESGLLFNTPAPTEVCDGLKSLARATAAHFLYPETAVCDTATCGRGPWELTLHGTFRPPTSPDSPTFDPPRRPRKHTATERLQIRSPNFPKSIYLHDNPFPKRQPWRAGPCQKPSGPHPFS